MLCWFNLEGWNSARIVSGIKSEKYYPIVPNKLLSCELVVQGPFRQLWSIHAFLKQNDCTKLVPLLFVLMSRRCKEDYNKILNYLKEKLPNPMTVTEVVMDFEPGVWSSFRTTLPDVTLCGCSLHVFGRKCVWKKIQDKVKNKSYYLFFNSVIEQKYNI